jgi:hypothetical protein
VYENLTGNKALKIMREMVMNAGGYIVGSILLKNSFDKDPLTGITKIQIENITNNLIKKITAVRSSI